MTLVFFLGIDESRTNDTCVLSTRTKGTTKGKIKKSNIEIIVILFILIFVYIPRSIYLFWASISTSTSQIQLYWFSSLSFIPGAYVYGS